MAQRQEALVAPCTEDEYKKACEMLEKYENGTKQPEDEELLANYDESQYSDEQIYADMIRESAICQTKPNYDRIKNKALESIILVDNIPETTKDRMSKLQFKIEEKINKQKNSKNATFEIKAKFYPSYEDKPKNEPYCLFQLSSEQGAREFQRHINNFKFTQSSIFQTYNLATIDKYVKSPDTWERPNIVEKTFDKDLEAWQEDNNDHFLIIQNTTATVYRNKCGFGVNKLMAPTGPEEIATKVGIAGEWPNIRWSPQGNYLLVIDTRMRGIGLFAVTDMEAGGSGFTVKEKFQLQGAFNAEFAPDEKHIMFQSGQTDDNGCFRDGPIKPEIAVYSVLDGEKKKQFRFSPGGHCGALWEKFQWSHDGRFLGTQKNDHLCIFDTQNDFKPVVDRDAGTGEFIYVPGLRTFQFSPADNSVCYWVPECGERPLKVVVRDISNDKLEIIRTKNLYKVKDVEMKWHPQGTYLALRCSKPMKGRKTALQSSFELFHIKEKECPIDVFDCEQYIQEYDPKEPHKIFDKQWNGGFEWEPNGNRFAIFYGPNDLITKTIIRIFKPQIGTSKIKELPQLERINNHNSMNWCPSGRYLVLAQFKKGSQSGGALEWIDADGELIQDKNKYIQAKNKDLRKPITIKVESHQFMTDLTWDATGRYVVTSSSMYTHKMENGIKMWNFQGKELYARKMDAFYDFKWRPRPKTVLSQEKIKEINASIKEYAKKFQESDALASIQVSAEEQGKLLRKINDFNNRINDYYDQRCRMAQYLKELDGDVDDHIEEIEVQNCLNYSTSVVARMQQDTL